MLKIGVPGVYLDI